MMEFTVPEARLFLVEYPGYVQHEDRVLQTLGGLDGIARQLQDNADVLPLKFRLGDPYAHAVYGNKHLSSCLLVKLTRRTRRRGQPGAWDSGEQQEAGGDGGEQGEQGEQAAAEAVARVETTYRFSTPADYQYVSCDPRPGAIPAPDPAGAPPAGTDPPGFPPQPLFCMPPLFAKQPVFDYAFRGYLATGAAAEARGGVRQRQGRRNLISFFTQHAPPAAPERIKVAEGLGHLVEVLRGLLRQRPMWVRGAIEEALPPPYTWEQAAEVLPKICYRFRNGPWKNAWLKRGFDPRNDPRARGYQVIEYHLPDHWHSKLSELRRAGGSEGEASPEAAGHPSSSAAAAAATAAAAALPPIASTLSDLLSFKGVPDRQACYLPLRFIRDARVQELLGDPANHSQVCTDISGWLVPAAWAAMRARVKERFQALLDGWAAAEGVGGGEDLGLLPGQEEEEEEAEWAQAAPELPQAAAAAAAVGQSAPGAASGAAAAVDGLAHQAAQQPHLGSKEEAQPAGTAAGGTVEAVASDMKVASPAKGRRPRGGRASAGAAAAGAGADAVAPTTAAAAATGPGSPGRLAAAAARAVKAAAAAAGVPAAAAAATSTAAAPPLPVAPAQVAAPEQQDVAMRDAEAEPQAPQAAAGAAVRSLPAPQPRAATAADDTAPVPAGRAAGGGWPPEPGEVGGDGGLLPVGLMASLQDYLAHIPEQEGEEYALLEEDEEEGEEGLGAGAESQGAGAGFSTEEYQTEGYLTEEGGYQTEGAGYQTDELVGQSEEEEEE